MRTTQKDMPLLPLVNKQLPITKRKVLFFLFIGVTIAFYFPSLRSLISLSYGSDAYEHILLIPFISGYFLFRKLKSIDNQKSYAILPGSLLVLTGIIAWLLQMPLFLSALYGSLSLKILSMMLVFIGGIVCLFGTQLFKNALFPIAFLFLMVPLPDLILNWIISFYQVGTSAVVDMIFKISGITYFRDGTTFYLPNLSINIAPQCSGIRSSTALIITGIIGGHVFLRTLAGKTILILLTIPLVLLKNGIRVATLTLLGAFVNMSFINGDLHNKGGFVFFLVALVLLFGGMSLIRRIEKIRALS